MKSLLILITLIVGLRLSTSSILVTFPHAVALRGCTQEDAPALELYLTPGIYSGQGEPHKPYLHIELAGSNWEKLRGRDLDLLPLSRQGIDTKKPIVRADLNLEEQSPVWLRGSLHLEVIDVGRKVVGAYKFVEAEGIQRSGVFNARWIPLRQTCG